MLYICTEEGVYRHRILGMYADLERAIERGKKYLTEEQKDAWHLVDISTIESEQDLMHDVNRVVTVERVGYSARWETQADGKVKRVIVTPGEIKVTYWE